MSSLVRCKCLASLGSGEHGKGKLAWKTLTAPDHWDPWAVSPTNYSILGITLSQLSDRQQRCQNQCFTLYYDLPELPHTSCVKAAGMHLIFYPSNSHTTSFLPSHLQSNPATILPSLFQASFILMRSKVFLVLTIYFHQATVMKLRGKLNMSKNRYTRLTARSEIQHPSTLNGRKQNCFKISLINTRSAWGIFRE